MLQKVSRNTVAEGHALIYSQSSHGMIFLNGMTTEPMDCFIWISLNIGPEWKENHT